MYAINVKTHFQKDFSFWWQHISTDSIQVSLRSKRGQ